MKTKEKILIVENLTKACQIAWDNGRKEYLRNRNNINKSKFSRVVWKDYSVRSFNFYTASDIKKRQGIPKLKLQALADYLGVDPAYLVGDTPEPTFGETLTAFANAHASAYNGFLNYLGISVKHKDNDGDYVKLPGWSEYEFIDSNVLNYIETCMADHTKMLFENFAHCGLSFSGSKGKWTHMTEILEKKKASGEKIDSVTVEYYDDRMHMLKALDKISKEEFETVSEDETEIVIKKKTHKE